MTDQLERRLRDVFIEEATHAPQASGLATDVVRRVRQRRRHLAWATSGSVVLIALCVLISAGLPRGHRVRPAINAATPAPIVVSPATPRRGALPGGSNASCAFGYSATTLARQAFAFDGTVTDIGPARTNRLGGAALPLVAATFRVHEWFHGGSGATVTVDIDPPQGGGEGDLPSYGVGTRLLISGQHRWGGPGMTDAIAWSCGFSIYYDPATAQTWRTVFG